MNTRLILIQAMFLIFLLFIAGFNEIVFAQNPAAQPRLEADPKAEYFAENLNPSYWRSLFDLAYWAGGDGDAEKAADDFVPVIKELYSVTSSMNDLQKGEAVLNFMHNNLLRTYHVKQSSLKTLLSSGSFNCVSSSVLYAILGTAVGLDVSGVNTVDHAFCLVSIDDRDIDVETTNAYGFDPGKKVEFQDRFGKTTGFSYVPPANYRDRSTIKLVNLFALILQNRIADAEDVGDYAAAVGPAVDRWVLLGGGPGTEFEDLIIRMLNYGTMLSRAGLEEDALAWAEMGISAYGPHEKWDEFINGVVNNMLVKLIRSGRTEEARMRLDEFKPRLTQQAVLAMELMVSDTELLDALDAVKAGGSEEDFKAVLRDVRLGGAVAEERILEVELDWRLGGINGIAGTEGWEAAYNAVSAAIAEMGRLPQLMKAQGVYLSNWKAELYNAAVRAFNAGRISEANALALQAADKFPDEAVFQSLIKSTEQALNRQ
ncbi:MAG: hypothetical protein PQJ61_14065 [Spirochaetales bacterium]|uniref:Protein SirB1 N-terminal domain-containing protein n=1 Tax=Candidatus Thalassospirochaeta sargassi TaxID=3119039 RepID=A0AAJ1IEK5_9SPIO|nr:hypothetical protein [Spirochaetales bacterium]